MSSPAWSSAASRPTSPLSALVVERREIVPADGHGAAGRAVLRLPAVRTGPEAESQGVVVVDQGPERPTEDADVHTGRHLEQHALVEVVDPGRGVVEEPALRRREVRRSGLRGLVGSDGVAGVGAAGDGGELGDGLALEQLGHAELETGGACPGHDLQAQDGVAAQLEEVVVDADAVDADDVPPDAGERLLGRGAGGDELLDDLGTLVVGRRQGVPVHLAVRGERDGVDDDEGGRHHEVGHAVGEVAPQRRAEVGGDHPGQRVVRLDHRRRTGAPRRAGGWICWRTDLDVHQLGGRARSHGGDETVAEGHLVEPLGVDGARRALACRGGQLGGGRR